MLGSRSRQAEMNPDTWNTWNRRRWGFLSRVCSGSISTFCMLFARCRGSVGVTVRFESVWEAFRGVGWREREEWVCRCGRYRAYSPGLLCALLLAVSLRLYPQFAFSGGFREAHPLWAILSCVNLNVCAASVMVVRVSVNPCSLSSGLCPFPNCL